MKTCAYCLKPLFDYWQVCPHCGKPTPEHPGSRETSTAGHKPFVPRTGRDQIIAATFLAFLVLFAASMFRFYYGGNIGMRLVRKESPSFKDTIVNLDDILGMPRIVVATQHPAVKRQLEQMGIIESDEELEERLRREIREETEKSMREIEEQSRRIMRQMGY